MLRLEVIGNLGADAVVKASDGKSFVSFRVAHSEKWADANGVDHTDTQWVDCVISNPENKVVPYLKTGTRVYVRGHVKLRVYSSPAQKKMMAGVQISVQEIELLGGNSDAVPRRLVDPETSALLDVQKFYWCNADTKGMKKDDTRLMLDERGGQYLMNKQGFVAPVPANNEAQEDNTQSGE